MPCLVPSHMGRRTERNVSRIYKTDNGGRSWKSVDEGLLNKKIDGADDPEFASIATSYYHPENIYISYSELHFHEDSVGFGVAKSSDYGASWELSWNDRLSTREEFQRVWHLPTGNLPGSMNDSDHGGEKIPSI